LPIPEAIRGDASGEITNKPRKKEPSVLFFSGLGQTPRLVKKIIIKTRGKYPIFFLG